MGGNLLNSEWGSKTPKREKSHSDKEWFASGKGKTANRKKVRSGNAPVSKNRNWNQEPGIKREFRDENLSLGEKNPRSVGN